MSKKFGWDYIVSQELDRMRDALTHAQDGLLREECERLHRELSPREAAESQVELTGDLAAIRGLAWFGIKTYIEKRFPSPLAHIDGRSQWEIYLSGMRVMLLKFPNSYFCSAIFTMFQMDDVKRKLLSYGHEFESHLPAFHRVMQDMVQFQEHFERGEEDMRPHREPDHDLVRTYAMYKTWLQDDQFTIFSRAYDETCRSAITLIIEGPLQLYIMISSENLQIILKAFTAERLSDLWTSDYVKDVMHLGKHIEEGVSASLVRRLGLPLMKKFAEEYLAEWHQDMAALRAQYSTVDRRERFIHQFEQGVLFSNS